MIKYIIIIVIIVSALFALRYFKQKNKNSITKESNFCIVEDCYAKNEKNVMQTISAEMFYDKVAVKNNVVIDVRTAHEFESGSIGDAINKDVSTEQFQEYITNIDKDTVYLVYCRSGHRSKQAILLMNAAGFKNVYDLNGGIIAWKRAGYEVVQN